MRARVLLGAVAIAGASLGLWLGWRVVTAATDALSIQAAYGVDEVFAAELVLLAEALGMRPSHLAAVIHFESGTTWSASVVHPSGEAVGLIQFRARTATRLGTTLEELRAMSRNEQLVYVGQYFRLVAAGDWPDDPHAGRLDTLQAVAMAVFYPAYRYVAPTTPFPASVQAANPGIRTPDDYLRKVRNLAREAL